MEKSLDIAKKLIGAKYKLWLGDFQKTDDTPEDPYGESSPENVMKYLQSLNQSNNISK